MPEFSTFKRWQLNEGHEESQVVSLVQERIAPAYATLPGCKGLGLLRIEGTRCYLAIQYWESRFAYDHALQAPEYAEWFEAYQPALARWHEMLTFQDEWCAETIL